MNVIEFDEECKSCGGTGIYVGMAERDGYGVVCHKCKGTGKFHFKHEYESFETRKVRSGIRKVVKTNPGICLGGNLDFGGISYTAWLQGMGFPVRSEMRNFTCPHWWFQTTGEHYIDWRECTVCGSFSECEHFKTKEKCWEKFDNEF